jgi:hypothetical protein
MLNARRVREKPAVPVALSGFPRSCSLCPSTSRRGAPLSRGSRAPRLELRNSIGLARRAHRLT